MKSFVFNFRQRLLEAESFIFKNENFKEFQLKQNLLFFSRNCAYVFSSLMPVKIFAEIISFFFNQKVRGIRKTVWGLHDSKNHTLQFLLITANKTKQKNFCTLLQTLPRRPRVKKFRERKLDMTWNSQKFTLVEIKDRISGSLYLKLYT